MTPDTVRIVNAERDDMLRCGSESDEIENENLNAMS